MTGVTLSCGGRQCNLRPAKVEYNVVRWPRMVHSRKVAGGKMKKSSGRSSFGEGLFQQGTTLLSEHWHGPVMKTDGSKNELGEHVDATVLLLTWCRRSWLAVYQRVGSLYTSSGSGELCRASRPPRELPHTTPFLCQATSSLVCRCAQLAPGP